ncbi:MAG: TIGR00266 family protein [Verrucomicrobiales bacterium]|nr:TIGR00266 family protein [Verrucomicrobiales bacterium]
MRHLIEHAPTFTTVEFYLDSGESVTVQPGCMLGMTTGFDLKSGLGTHVKGVGGVGRALRSTLAGESFLAAIYTAKRDGERLLLAPSEQGDIRALDVAPGSHRYIAPGAFLACHGDVRIGIEYAGVRGWMATRGLFLMRTEGTGTVFVSSHGALRSLELAEGERYVLDNRYIVAFADGMKFETVKVAKTLRHSFLTGEGFANRFTGPGTLLFQTRARPGRGFLRGIADLAT